ncbi:CHASE2 domain-containing protein [Paenibacillus sp. J22TS3]|uniref:CHASE2 domain-containing protein n=1 Tax=Paenibacillus sp. J22TS3 TaxID=2807192 RepID=UPI001B0C2D3C|nr:adenylate/guanylate cyclase domain-containing protein [Paenibacillus sp. J22TS3]GIP24066.1 adenylate/guanylate cyclase domain-containing protein [Paenibacillus sp. J22TS3]
MRLKLAHLLTALTLVVLLLMAQGALAPVDNYVQDKIMQQRGSTDTRIVIIGMDDQSLHELGQWPWNRSVHAQLIDTLSQGKPAVIAFDVTFAENARDPSGDEQLVKSVRKSGNVVMPTFGQFASSAKRGIPEAQNMSAPFPSLGQAAAALGHINAVYDNDQVVRKSLYQFTYQGKVQSSFAWEIYRMYMRHEGQQADEGILPLDPFGRFHIPYTGRPGDYEVIPYASVIHGEVPPDYFKDRIVLIGPYAAGFKDDYATPLAPKLHMYGVEIHANIIQALLDGKLKTELDWKWDAALLLIFAVCSCILFSRAHPAISLGAVTAALAAILYAGKLLYAQGVIVSVGYLMVYLIVSLICAVGFKYIQERLERKRVTHIFGRYVAPQVVKQILQNGEEGLKLGGSRRILTVLFVDIRGFTPLSERAEPEDIVEVLNEYLDLTANCIFEQDGTLDKFIGDAAMAIFNAPLEQEDHAMRAVRAAWMMKEKAAGLRDKLISKYGFSIQFGIGVHTGPAVFGNIGSKTRMDYTAIGDSVNTAARLEGAAEPGQILLSETTYQAVRDRVHAAGLGEIKVKGKEQRLQIYELEGLR